MRKPTAPRTRKTTNARSGADDQGLIANATKGRLSAGTESVVDNHSHRTCQSVAGDVTTFQISPQDKPPLLARSPEGPRDSGPHPST